MPPGKKYAHRHAANDVCPVPRIPSYRYGMTSCVAPPPVNEVNILGGFWEVRGDVSCRWHFTETRTGGASQREASHRLTKRHGNVCRRRRIIVAQNWGGISSAR